MKYTKFLTMVLMLILAFGAFAQESPPGYNPFVPANLDDTNKLQEASVVESSYHYYSLPGDPNFTDASTFVWYVENGTLGTYDPASDTWVALAGVVPISNGVYAELTGTTIDGVFNSSGIWVRWNDATGGNVGYIAVYERSSNQCVFDGQINGFKHTILIPPEVWFTVNTRQECSDQTYAVDIQFDKLDQLSYPYTLTFTYPDLNGAPVQATLVINDGDLSATLGTTIDIIVSDLNVAVDEMYSLSLDELRDKFGSLGRIAPLGAAQGQYPEITITTFHLPQTGGMIMN